MRMPFKSLSGGIGVGGNDYKRLLVGNSPGYLRETLSYLIKHWSPVGILMRPGK